MKTCKAVQSYKISYRGAPILIKAYLILYY